MKRHFGSQLEREFETALNRFGKDLTDGMHREYSFHPKRRWRFDFAWPEKKVAVEIDGGQWAPGGGRHNQDPDREKMNAAAANGWRVLRFSGKQVSYTPLECLGVLREAMK